MPLMHAQNLGAKADRRSSPILMGLGLPLFLRCQQSRVRVSHRAAGGSVPAEIRQNTAESAAWSLLARIRRGTLSMSVTCSARRTCGARSSDGGVMQPGKGPIPVLTRRGAGEIPAPGLSSQREGALWPR